MRKNLLSLSIAAMIGGLGLAGGASAAVFTGGTTANDLVLAPEGIGHILLVPYYTAQSSNMTLLNIVNTDEQNGKVVKVRFRGAANSDDVFDFLLFLSPGDVWAANISKNAVSGVAHLTTPDNSCVLPQDVKAAAGQDFATNRVDPVGGNAGKAIETLEGYVEILNTANISDVNSKLYKTTKHDANGNVECAKGSLDDAFRNEIQTQTAAISLGLSNPTGGLFANWSIFNVADASSWTGAATAVVATNDLATRAPAPANIVVFPQVFGTPGAYGVSGGVLANLTADPLMTTGTASGGQVKLQNYDLPDLSTPYVNNSTTAAAQAETLTSALAKTKIQNEFITDVTVNASTDWIFSMPTRRYAVAMNYSTGVPVFNAANNKYFSQNNVTVSSVINGKKLACVNVDSVSFYNRSEATPGIDENEIIISPNEPEAPQTYNFCGEVSLWTLSPGATGLSTLNGVITTKDANSTYTDGWATYYTPGLNGNGLPILGSSVMKFLNGPMGYGLTFPHRYQQGRATPNTGG